MSLRFTPYRRRDAQSDSIDLASENVWYLSCRIGYSFQLIEELEPRIIFVQHMLQCLPPDSYTDRSTLVRSALYNIRGSNRNKDKAQMIYTLCRTWHHRRLALLFTSILCSAPFYATGTAPISDWVEDPGDLYGRRALYESTEDPTEFLLAVFTTGPFKRDDESGDLEYKRTLLNTLFSCRLLPNGGLHPFHPPLITSDSRGPLLGHYLPETFKTIRDQLNAEACK